QLLRFIPDNTKIPFISWRKIALVLSLVTSLVSLGWFGINGLNLGIDFKGGTAIEVQHQGGPADVGHIRQVLNQLELGEVQVQGFGTPEDVLIRVQLQEGGAEAQQAAVDAVATT